MPSTRILIADRLCSVLGLERSFDLHGQDVPVLRGLDLDVVSGSSVGIRGASGSGKSTLLSILGLVDARFRGRYTLLGTDVAGASSRTLNDLRLRKLGVAFQDLWLVGSLTALENALVPGLARGDALDAAEARARKLLEASGLARVAEHRPSELSGGERRRVALVRSIMNRPPLLLVDEPTAELDAESRLSVLQLLQQAQAEGSTLVAASHDEELLALCDRTYRMEKGRLEPAA